MKKRRYFLLVISCIAILTLVACADNTKDNNTPTTPATSQETQGPTETKGTTPDTDATNDTNDTNETNGTNGNNGNNGNNGADNNNGDGILEDIGEDIEDGINDATTGTNDNR